jgi:cobalamin biosynthesis protein CobD/CbiB
MFGQQPTVRAFKGEEALTSALLEITEEKQSKLYFLSGHGEAAPNAEDLRRAVRLSRVVQAAALVVAVGLGGGVQQWVQRCRP